MKKLTIYDIENVIVKEEYVTLGVKTTACVLTLKNGFECIGTSACIDPKNYNIELGKTYARQRAIDKVWEVEGYKAQCEN